MQTTLEITTRILRLCIVRAGRVVELLEFPIPEGMSGVDYLSEAPLPAGVGQVRVVIDHEDMLLRPLTQPISPPERMERIIRLEMGDSADLGTAQPYLDWTVVHSDADECRVIVMLVKAALVTQIQAGLQPHGATMVSLIHPAMALVAAWRATRPRDGECALIMDIGGARIHSAVVREGASSHGLLFARSNGPGADDLSRQVMAKRHINADDARAILARLTANGPADLLDAVRACGGQIAAQAIAVERFAKTQLKLSEVAIDAVYVAGAGAQIPAFTEAMAARIGKPVRPLNPFADVALNISAGRLDQLAGLPSPWTVCLMGADLADPVLDVAHELARQRRQWWMTTGALRVGAAAAAALLVATIALVYVAGGAAEAAAKELSAKVSKAQKDKLELDQKIKGKIEAAARVRWLANERLPGRVAVELLAAISAAQDPVDRPIVISDFKIIRRADGVEAYVSGTAQSAGTRGPAEVLRGFESELRTRLPHIVAIVPKATTVSESGHQFAYRLDVKL